MAKTRKNRGGGLKDTLYKYAFGEKRAELLPQAKSIYKGFRQGYGLGGIGGWTDFAWDNGTNERLQTVRLSDIILWHPVRGAGEREQAGVKTTKRADSMYEVLINNLSRKSVTKKTITKRTVTQKSTRVITPKKESKLFTVTFSRKHPFTYAQLNKINEMQSDDTIKICPLNITNDADDAEQINILSKKIIVLNKKISITKNQTAIRALNAILNKTRVDLQNLLYKDEKYKQSFLVLSGQGRLQAIIEAVKKANIPLNEFYIRLTCKDVYLDICNVLLKIHNDWVENGDFKDERHEVYIDGEYYPMEKLPLAFSCSKTRSKLDTLCYARYNSGTGSKENMGCSDIYDYTKRIPLSRLFTE